MGRKTFWIAGAAVVIIGFFLFLLLSWKQTQNDIRLLKNQRTEMASSISDARSIIDKAKFARPWCDGEPKYLNCLRELTLTFPLEGRIWNTNLSIQDAMQVKFSGKAIDKPAVLEVLDRLEESSKFTQVKSLYLHESGDKAKREITFAISFIYVRSEEI